MQFFDKVFSTKISAFTGERFSTILENFTYNIFLASNITAFTIFYSVFQNYAEKWTVTCNV